MSSDTPMDGSDRRKAERRKAQSAFDGEERRSSERRNGEDRRRTPRSETD